jgi:hypothetical protein
MQIWQNCSFGAVDLNPKKKLAGWLPRVLQALPETLDRNFLKKFLEHCITFANGN